MLVYTSITKSYLPKARVLAKSVKRFHPTWTFVLLYSDDLPVDFDLKNEPFDEVLTIEQLGIPNWKAWAFGHALVELCTAVKGPAAKLLAKRPGIDKIMYLDPDIKVFNSLSTLESLLDQHDILLTPHLLDPEQDIHAIQDNEISALKHGIYNLGFFAATTKGQGFDFICWWADRLRLFCRDHIPGGLFTDQRWCDLAPAFFSNLGIVRDRGCNVATWNIAHRPLSKDKAGLYCVAGVPLRFYHFTSYDNGNGFGMLMKYAATQALAHELWGNYGKDLLAEGQGDEHLKNWYYGQFEQGESIPLESRRTYQARQYLQKTFPNPYSIVEPCYLSWWKANGAQNNLTLPYHAAGKINRSVAKKIVQGMISPRFGMYLAKSALRILKNDGMTALILRIRSHSL